MDLIWENILKCQKIDLPVIVVVNSILCFILSLNQLTDSSSVRSRSSTSSLTLVGSICNIFATLTWLSHFHLFVVDKIAQNWCSARPLVLQIKNWKIWGNDLPISSLHLVISWLRLNCHCSTCFDTIDCNYKSRKSLKN